VLVLAAGLGLAPAAHAAIAPATVVDGPSADVVDLGGVALAPDGSGGIVYRKRVDGVPHIFAARFADGRWGAPLRVDAGQRFASSWPRIVAIQRGTLRVVWVQEFGPGTDRLYAATAADGGGFGAPWLVDANIGEATATWPVLAAEPGGRTYLAYRVLGFTGQSGNPPPGYVAGQIRLARFKGPGWESLGIVARNPATFVRAPSAENQPRLAVTASGDAVVAWQEPDDDFVDRIWARRIFASGLGIPLLASPAAADAFDLGGGAFGEATVVARVQPPGGAGGAPRLYVDSLPSMFEDKSAAFTGARPLGGAVAGLGVPAVADDGTSAWGVVAGAGPQVLAGAGDDQATGALGRVDDGTGAGDAAPAVVAGTDGSGVVAWRLTRGARSGVALRVTDTRGRRSAALVAAPAGGPVDDLAAAGSGLGDALVAFRQGGDGAGAIAVATVDAPPQAFHVFAPLGWVRGRRARVTWEAAADALGPVRYTLVVDGRRLSSQYGRSRVPYRDRLDDGRYRVTVLATDARGQQTLGSSDTLHVDGTPPTAAIALHGRRLRVRVSDGPRGQVAGVRPGGTRVRFGDGHSAGGGRQVTHRYRRPGRYRVRVAVRDRAGNRAALAWTVHVR